LHPEYGASKAAVVGLIVRHHIFKKVDTRSPSKTVYCYGSMVMRSHGAVAHLFKTEPQPRLPDPPAPSPRPVHVGRPRAGPRRPGEPYRVVPMASPSWSHCFLSPVGGWVIPDREMLICQSALAARISGVLSKEYAGCSDCVHSCPSNPRTTIPEIKEAAETIGRSLRPTTAFFSLGSIARTAFTVNARRSSSNSRPVGCYRSERLTVIAKTTRR
jgi:hypothetical protein